MSRPGTDNEAVMAGYTRCVLLSLGENEFAALIKPDADLDDCFTCFDTDNQEWLRVNGWLLSDVQEAG